jgi:hypothetical protein
MGTPVVFADRVLLTTSTISTGTYAIGAAVTGYLSPAQAGVVSGSRVSYVVVDSLTAPTVMEVGEGVYSTGTPDQLTRAQIRRNTTGGTSEVNWAAGTKFIAFAPCAANLPSLETDGRLSAPSIISAGLITAAGGFSATGGNVIANAGALYSYLSGAANTGAVFLGNAGYRLFWSGSLFDLNASLTVSGNVTWTSDRRLKRNIRPARVGLKQALGIQPVTFERVGGGKERSLGFIAQEVQAAHRGAAFQTGDGGMLSVSAAGMDAILLGAIRDLAAKVERLEAKVEQLERGNAGR